MTFVAPGIAPRIDHAPVMSVMTAEKNTRPSSSSSEKMSTVQPPHKLVPPIVVFVIVVISGAGTIDVSPVHKVDAQRHRSSESS